MIMKNPWETFLAKTTFLIAELDPYEKVLVYFESRYKHMQCTKLAITLLII